MISFRFFSCVLGVRLTTRTWKLAGGASAISSLFLVFVFTLGLFLRNFFFQSFLLFKHFLAFLALVPPVTNLIFFILCKESIDCGFSDPVSWHLLEAGKSRFLKLESFQLWISFQIAWLWIVSRSWWVWNDRLGKRSLRATECAAFLGRAHKRGGWRHHRTLVNLLERTSIITSLVQNDMVGPSRVQLSLSCVSYWPSPSFIRSLLGHGPLWHLNPRLAYRPNAVL